MPVKAKVLPGVRNVTREIIMIRQEIIKSIRGDLGREMKMGSYVYDRVILINRDGNMRDQHNYFEVL